MARCEGLGKARAWLAGIELPHRLTNLRDLPLRQLGEDGKAHHLLGEGLRHRQVPGPSPQRLEAFLKVKTQRVVDAGSNPTLAQSSPSARPFDGPEGCIGCTRGRSRGRPEGSGPPLSQPGSRHKELRFRRRPSCPTRPDEEASPAERRPGAHRAGSSSQPSHGGTSGSHRGPGAWIPSRQRPHRRW